MLSLVRISNNNRGFLYSNRRRAQAACSILSPLNGGTAACNTWFSMPRPIRAQDGFSEDKNQYVTVHYICRVGKWRTAAQMDHRKVAPCSPDGSRESDMEVFIHAMVKIQLGPITELSASTNRDPPSCVVSWSAHPVPPISDFLRRDLQITMGISGHIAPP